MEEDTQKSYAQFDVEYHRFRDTVRQKTEHAVVLYQAYQTSRMADAMEALLAMAKDDEISD